MPHRLVEASYSTVACSIPGIEVRVGDHWIFIITDADVEPDLWLAVIRLLGLIGQVDYEVLYDPGTRKETYVYARTSELVR